MLEELRKLESEGYLRSVRHRELPLSVFNYTPKTQYERAFGDYPILRLCRGIVLDDEGKVWASPFPKFFNYEEHDVSELPHGQKIEITQQMDGSLLIVFRYEDKVVYSTRGSFYSDQAIAGGQLFRELYEEDWVQDGLTYLFEYVGPDNRIVVDYEYDDLIHLGLINTQSGSDLPRDERFTCVSTYDVEGGLFGHDLYSKLKSLNTSNEEGFVIRAISDGDSPDWRCKIKFEDYCKLHKIVTGVSNKTIWENLRSNTSFDDILEITPDEFNDWLRITKKNFETEYELILAQAKMAYNEVKDLETRKDQAITLLANHKDISHIVFKMLNEREYSSEIWDMLKPPKFVQPFSSKGEE